jgi:hypothetical protein
MYRWMFLSSYAIALLCLARDQTARLSHDALVNSMLRTSHPIDAVHRRVKHKNVAHTRRPMATIPQHCPER